MTDIVPLGLRFESQEAEVANKRLDNVADSAQRAEKAADGLAAGSKRSGGAIAQMVASIDKQLKALVELQRVQERAIGTANDQARATASLAQQQEAAIRTAERLNATHGRVVDTTKSVQQATLNMGRQFADIGTQLGSGQSPFLILIQQGPQIVDIFAQLKTQGIGTKAALAAMAAEFGPIAAVALPLAAVAAAVSAIGIAAFQGEKEASRLANTLALAGSNAGLTAVQFETFTNQVAGETKSSVDQARGALLALVQTGQLSGETIKVLGADVVTFARMTGKSTDEAAAYFAKMGNDVGEFAADFQKHYGGLTAAQVEHIRLLEKQGATTQAQLELAIAIHKRLGQAGPENLGYLEKAWRGVGTAIANAWSWLKMWGNEAAQRAARIPQLEKAIADERKNGSPDGGYRLGLWEKELTALKAAEGQAQKSAQAQAAANQTQIDGTQAAIEHANSWSKIAKNVGLANDEIARYRKGQADIRAANPNSKELDSPTQAAAIEAAIRKRYEHLSSGNGAAMRAIRADNRGDSAIEQAKTVELAAQAALTKNIEQLSGIKAAQIAQELKGQEVRLIGQVKAKEISQADADAALSHYRAAAAAKQQALNSETANQIANRDLAQRQELLGYAQRTASIQASAAKSVEEANTIEAKALAERQAYDRDALQESVAQRVMSGEITLTRGKLLLVEQAIGQSAETEEKARQDRLRIFQRDLELAQAAAANQVDILNSRRGLAQSSYEAAQIERQILNTTYAAERDRLTKIIANTDTDAKTLAASQDRLSTIEEIHRNELRQLELSDNAVTAYADLVGALSNAARSVVDGDIGGAISAGGGVLKQLSGLTGSAALATAASYAGPIGAAVSAVTGVLGAIGDRSAAKAQAKIEKLTKAVEDLRADNKASSGSIAGALEQANKAWNSDLEYTSQMVTSLRSIDGQIGSLANSLSRSITAGNLLSTAGLGLGTTTSKGSALFGLANLFLGGSKTTTELLDQGLNFNAASYNDIVNGGVSGSTYADLATTKTKKFLGVAYSTKVKTSTVNGAIDGDLLSQISGVIQALGDGVLSAASVFGTEAAKAAESALGLAVVDLGKLSLKGLKADEIAEVLNATFDKVGDQLAAAGVPGLDKLADVGEGAFETLTRLAREYQVVDVALASIGKTFGQVGLESIAARDELVKLFGGMDEFTSQTSFFATNFLTDAERLAPVIKAVNDNLKAYGLTAESSRDQFKALVLAQDLTTEAGRNTYAALLAVAPAFDKVASAVEETTKAAAEAELKGYQDRIADQVRAQNEIGEATTKALDGITSSINDMVAAGRSAADQFNALAKTLQDFADSLATEVTGKVTEATYASARAAFLSAQGADIATAGKAFLDVSKAYSTSTLAYQADAALVRARASAGAANARQNATDEIQTRLNLAALLSGGVAALTGLPKAANGGSFTVAGYSGTDQNLMSINGQPALWVNQGEVVSVAPTGRPSNDNSYQEMVAELRALRQQVADLQASNRTMERTLTQVTEGGRAMQTEVAS